MAELVRAVSGASLQAKVARQVVQSCSLGTDWCFQECPPLPPHPMSSTASYTSSALRQAPSLLSLDTSFVRPAGGWARFRNGADNRKV